MSSALHRATALMVAATGFSGVLLAALGAHAVPGMGQEAVYRSWTAASLIHLAHAAALLALLGSWRHRSARLLLVNAWLMFTGVLLFSGSIYVRILLDLESTAGLAPVGGVLLMISWLLTALASWRG